MSQILSIFRGAEKCLSFTSGDRKTSTVSQIWILRRTMRPGTAPLTLTARANVLLASPEKTLEVKRQRPEAARRYEAHESREVREPEAQRLGPSG